MADPPLRAWTGRLRVAAAGRVRVGLGNPHRAGRGDRRRSCGCARRQFGSACRCCSAWKRFWRLLRRPAQRCCGVPLGTAKLGLVKNSVELAQRAVPQTLARVFPFEYVYETLIIAAVVQELYDED